MRSVVLALTFLCTISRGKQFGFKSRYKCLKCTGFSSVRRLFRSYFICKCPLAHDYGRTPTNAVQGKSASTTPDRTLGHKWVPPCTLCHCPNDDSIPTGWSAKKFEFYASSSSFSCFSTERLPTTVSEVKKRVKNNRKSPAARLQRLQRRTFFPRKTARQ